MSGCKATFFFFPLKNTPLSVLRPFPVGLWLVALYFQLLRRSKVEMWLVFPLLGLASRNWTFLFILQLVLLHKSNGLGQFKLRVIKAFPYRGVRIMFILSINSHSFESNSFSWTVGISLLHPACLWLTNLLWLVSWSSSSLHAAAVRGTQTLHLRRKYILYWPLDNQIRTKEMKVYGL